MEEFILSNVDRYRGLVAKFQPESQATAPTNAKPATDNIVCARVRPLSDEETETGFPAAVFTRPKEPGVFDVHELRKPVRGNPVLKSSAFSVDRAYDTDTTTEQIYGDSVEHLVPWVWGGGIGTLFAYGQTGSGKTFTVSGLEAMVAKTLMEGGLEGDRKVYISIAELAGNSAFDLLNSRRPIAVLEDSLGNTQLAGALEHQVNTTDEILGYIEAASKFRRTETTKKNDTSSRSHAICRIRVEIHDIPDAEDGILYLIDLAGSEAARDRDKHGENRMKESKEINVSLSVLKDCIRGKIEADALIGTTRKNRPYVPFRQSALTKILKHVFDPAGSRICKNVIMACVNPCLADISASRNTLRYAEMLRVFVSNTKEPAFDPIVPMTWNNAKLREWIARNSGTPAVVASILAPKETGAQLLRIPAPEFESRCMRSPGVIVEQAIAFRSKFWQLHVDSRKPKATDDAVEDDGPDTVLGHLKRFDRSSSKEVDTAAAKLPFKERIRPGMAISWSPPRDLPIGFADGLKIAVVLCPAAAAGSTSEDCLGKKVNPASGEHKTPDGKYKKYLCATVSPAVLPGAYEVSMWRNLVIDVDDMDAEVTLEYDSATRFYYLAV